MIAWRNIIDPCYKKYIKGCKLPTYYLKKTFLVSRDTEKTSPVLQTQTAALKETKWVEISNEFRCLDIIKCHQAWAQECMQIRKELMSKSSLLCIQVIHYCRRLRARGVIRRRPSRGMEIGEKWGLKCWWELSTNHRQLQHEEYIKKNSSLIYYWDFLLNKFIIPCTMG